MSCESDVASMNSTASAVLTLGREDGSERQRAQTQTGRSLTSSVGSASSWLARPGWCTRAAMPSSAGTNAKSISATAFHADADAHRPLARRAVRLLQQAGRHHERRHEQREERCRGGRRSRTARAPVRPVPRQQTADSPPADCSTSGSAMANPPSWTTSCTRLTHAEPEQAARGEVGRHRARRPAGSRPPSAARRRR